MLYFLMCHSKTVWKSESERCIRKLGLDWCGEGSIKLSTSPCFLKQGFKKKKKTWAKNKFAWGPYEWTFGTYRIDNPFTYFL